MDHLEGVAAALAAGLAAFPVYELLRRYWRDRRGPGISLPRLHEGDTILIRVEYFSPEGELVRRELTFDSSEAAAAAIAAIQRGENGPTITIDETESPGGSPRPD